MLRSLPPLPNFPTRRGIRSIVRLFLRLRLLWIVVIASLFLSGCVDYQVGIRFADANHGEMVHSIHFNQPITGISSTLLTTWLETIEKTVKKDGGRILHPSQQEWLIQVPFYNTKDLETKFSHLVQPPAPPRSRLGSKLPANVDSRLHFTTGNLILWQRHHLQYDLDLRGLEFALPTVESTADPVSIEIRLNTPWGAKPLPTPDTASVIQKRGNQLMWKPKPGQINNLDTVFWVPNYLGIGTVIIVLLVIVGIYRKSEMAPPFDRPLSEE